MTSTSAYALPGRTRPRKNASNGSAVSDGSAPYARSRVATTRRSALQAAYFEPAIAGDISAANLVLKVITRRSAILGFEKQEETAETPRTVVIGGSTEEYVAGLKAIVNGTHPRLAGE